MIEMIGELLFLEIKKETLLQRREGKNQLGGRENILQSVKEQRCEMYKSPEMKYPQPQLVH